jgi:hypothetical protein
MDVDGARWIVTAVFLALATACSASSSGEARSSGGDGGHVATDPDGGGDDGSEAPNYDAAVDYDAAVAACARFSNAVEQRECCEQELPRGYFTLQLAEGACVCGASGPCAGVCNFQECESVEGFTTSCQSCLDITLIGSCMATIERACAMDPGCIAYEACVQGA